MQEIWIDKDKHGNVYGILTNDEADGPLELSPSWTLFDTTESDIPGGGMSLFGIITEGKRGSPINPKVGKPRPFRTEIAAIVSAYLNGRQVRVYDSNLVTLAKGTVSVILDDGVVLEFVVGDKLSRFWSTYIHHVYIPSDDRQPIQIFTVTTARNQAYQQARRLLKDQNIKAEIWLDGTFIDVGPVTKVSYELDRGQPERQYMVIGQNRVVRFDNIVGSKDEIGVIKFFVSRITGSPPAAPAPAAYQPMNDEQSFFLDALSMLAEFDKPLHKIVRQHSGGAVAARFVNEADAKQFVQEHPNAELDQDLIESNNCQVVIRPTMRFEAIYFNVLDALRNFDMPVGVSAPNGIAKKTIEIYFWNDEKLMNRFLGFLRKTNNPALPYAHVSHESRTIVFKEA